LEPMTTGRKKKGRSKHTIVKADDQKKAGPGNLNRATGKKGGGAPGPLRSTKTGAWLGKGREIINYARSKKKKNT